MPRFADEHKIRAYFEILAELLIELLVIVLVLADVVKQFHTLLYQILADHLQDLALLKRLAGDVQWKILRVDDAFDEAEVFGNQFFAVVHDKHSPHVQLNVVALLAVLEQIERSSSRNEQQGAELELAFNGEVLRTRQP